MHSPRRRGITGNGSPTTSLASAAPGAPSRVGRSGVVVTGLSPVLLLGGILYHPELDDLRNQGNVAAALIADTTRWGVAHLAIGVAAALVLLGFLHVDTFLRANGSSRASAVGVPFVVVGSVLFVFLPAMEIAMLAVHTSGGDVASALREMNTWFQPILLAGAACFATGVVLFARAVAVDRVGGTAVSRIIVVALVVAAAARFVPLGLALYVGAAALVVALGSLALLMARATAGTTAGAAPGTTAVSRR